jgi:2-dehydro-3-deoxyphosphogluconate aldolase/(4S)-4-hydroxy-2-oxoglutarate aldolase
MRSRNEIQQLLTNPGVTAVIRAEKPQQVLPLAEALLAGGVLSIEVTMTTPCAIEVISDCTQKLGSRALVGVGTVLDPATARAAIEAGAEFVVTPVMRPAVVEAVHESGRVVMLGAFTPTEAQAAHEAGADFVKIFPSDTLGPGFIKAILAPLPHLRIIPTGIAKVEDVPAFIKAGCVGVGLGSLLVPREALREGNWAEITRLAAHFVALVAQARQK